MLIYFLGASTTLAACELIVGWEPWPPYQFANDEGQLTGVDGDLITAIGTEMGCKLSWVETTWKRQLAGIESGEISAVMSASHTPERAVFGRFSEIYRQSANHLVVSKALEGQYDSLEAFLDAGKKLGVMKDYHYGDEVMALLGRDQYGRQVQDTILSEANLRKLASGRIDGVLMDAFVISSLKREMGVADKLASSSIEVSTDGLHMLFSKVSVDQQTLDNFNTVLSRLQADGSIQKIIDQYSK
jgi:polar amino acid transport system substrate-binding protein